METYYIQTKWIKNLKKENYSMSENENKLIKNNFLVASDYNWLSDNIEETWIYKYTDNYLIYDKFHREAWPESSKIIKQKNVGQNHYDMFDFIVTHYDNLPEVTIFCRSCLFFPKGKKTGLPNKSASTGNYNETAFKKNCNNTVFTELHDFGPETSGSYSRIDTDGFGYLEINNDWYFNCGPSKYFKSFNKFLFELYKTPVIVPFIRFAPGGNYIIPKKNILRYSKKFYEYIREILSWDIITAEIWMVERATYTIFTCDWEVNEKYK